jgi:hypothetical protein
MKKVFCLVLFVYACILSGATSYNLSYSGILHSFEEYVGEPGYNSITSYGLSFPGILHSFDVYNGGYTVGYSEVGILTSLETVLYGQVYDNITEEGIDGAYIMIYRPGFNDNCETDEEGNYSFPDINEGSYTVLVTASGYQQRNLQFVVEDGVNIQNISMQATGGGTNSLIITNELMAYADNIEETSSNVFSLTGNVNINNQLFFEGEIEIDKRATLNYPEISSDCAYGVINNGDYQIIKQLRGDFEFAANGDQLLPLNELFNSLVPDLGGFGLKCGIITFHDEYISIGVLPEMSYPLGDIFDSFLEDMTGDLPVELGEISGAIHYYENDSEQIVFNLTGLSANFAVFSIEELNLYLDTSEDIFGGGFTLKIPGIPNDHRRMGDGDLDKINVLILDENGNYRDETDLESFIAMQRFLGADFLQLSVQMEFVSGGLNTLIISVSSNIPIGSTGLFITQLTGGVEDLQTENWLIVAGVSIETGLNIPGVGAAVSLANMTARIHPMNYFQGSGGIEIFGYGVSEGSIEYNGSINAFNEEGILTLGDILYGSQYASLRGSSFYGSGVMIVSTPEELPWYLTWAQDITIGSVEVEMNNYMMQSIVTLGEFLGNTLSLAQRIEFGNHNFPWFHYYLGDNYEHLYQIWRGVRDGRQVITFQVPENTGQLLAVAGNDQYLFDYELQAPDGTIYNENNCSYNQFNTSQQTVVVIDNPQSGDWDFVTDEEGEIITEFRCLDQQPTTLVSQPEQRGMRNNTVALSFNDYSDTLSVQVYYNTDNRHYNGVKIQEFELINNSELEFEWFNNDVPDGEYFIYTRISDGKNAPVLQYAPGSIIVDNVTIETPQNFNAAQNGESVEVSWNEPASELYLTTVYYEDLSNGMLDMKSVVGETEAVITGLTEGHPYKFYAVFIDDQYNESDPSEAVELVYYSAQRNNPPYFLMDSDIVYDFIAEEYGEIELIADDADNDNLSFSVLDNEIGLDISGNILNWMPTHENRGVHLMKITASDGVWSDTTTVQISVLTQQQAEVQLKFNSPNLFEEDNMYVKLKNFRCDELTQSVTLENMVTGDSEELELRKVNKFDYIGKFELSFRNRTMLWVANGDSIKAEYEYDGNTFQAYAVYDSLAQYSDDIAPAAVSDLEADLTNENQIVLNWTAPGDDGNSGNAYRYDIRYMGEPILSEDDWLWAQQITCSLYPQEAGDTEEFSFAISELENVAAYDSLFFMIKAEDEMQNWSEMSNNATLRFLMPPANVNAMLTDDYCAQLTWTGNETRSQSRQQVEFLYYNIYRQKDDGVLLPLVSEITSTNYTDTLFWQPDGNYTYAVQSVYTSGNSSRTESNPIELERFTDLRILCTLSDTTNYEGIEFSLTGLDSVYSQTYTYTTNLFGLLLLADVYKTEYLVEISKANYRPVSDTLSIDDNNNVFDFEVQRLLYGDIDLNGEVESLDASLVLQYFVLIEDIPQAPRPWQQWLINCADLDANGAVEAYDASLILQYVVGYINVFPAEE